MSVRCAAERALVITALFTVSGCGTFDVHLAGSLGSPGPGTPLGFDANGVPSISSGLGKRRVYLPAQRDDNTWGLVVVDGRALPPAWRSPYRDDGGLIVAALDKASPLAHAGLRMHDVIETVGGQEVQDLAHLFGQLEAVAPGDTLALEVTKVDGRRVTVEAERGREQLQAATAFHFPFVYQHSASSSGTAVGIGPLDGLFQMRTGVLLMNPPAPLLVHLRELDLQLQRAQWIAGLEGLEGVEMPDDPELITTALARSRAERRALVRAVDTRFVDRTSWGCLFNLFLYESETDLVTGEERSHIRLFWLFEFGDPIRDAGV